MAPLVLRTVAETAAWVESLRRSGRSLALVPTMGYLHEGHLSLMREGRRRADVVAASIFVNPTQFGPKEDLSRYPRDLEGDLARCASAGVEAVFAPVPAEVYPPGYQTYVDVEQVSQGLCGARRPGHFRGVATVVTKLLCLFKPQLALFGEKDYQQLQVIRALERDLNLGVEIIGMPTVREPDGLAMSSRNAYLSAAERAEAPRLYRVLQQVAAGELTPPQAVEILAKAKWKPDYVEVRRRADLALPQKADAGLVVLAAARLGQTRLIDNLEF
jgi:pantoate--beta-alanine ligase